MAHNGVLYNDKELRKKYMLPDTKIETDSYIAVQLLEHFGGTDVESIKRVSELVEGSFVFTILRDDNTLFLVKGSNPITLLHFQEYGLYLYASTSEILKAALKNAKFTAKYEIINIHTGDIVCIGSDGKLSSSTFKSTELDYGFHHYFSWYDAFEEDENHENDLLSICGYYGVDRKDVELLLEYGYTADEIEDMLYNSDFFEEAVSEIKSMFI